MNNIEEIKIQVPEGMEIDEKNSTFTCIKFKKKEKVLPSRWENIEGLEGFFITDKASIQETGVNCKTRISNKNILPTKELAEAMLALCQLIYLRDIYNDGWVADYTKKDNKYSFHFVRNTLVIITYQDCRRALSFKTKELRDLFLDNFKDLIEIAKPLI